MADAKNGSENAKKELKKAKSEFEISKSAMSNLEEKALLAKNKMDEAKGAFIAEKKETLEGIKSETEESERRCEDAEKMVNRFLKDKNELEVDLENAKTELDKIKVEYDPVEEERIKLEKDCNEIKDKIDTFSALLNKYNTCSDNLERAAEKDKEKFLAEQAELKKKMDEYRENEDEDYKKIYNRLISSKSSINKAYNDYIKAKGYEALRARYSDSKDKYESIEAELKDKTESYDKAYDSLQEKIEKRDELRTKLKEISDYVDNIEDNIPEEVSSKISTYKQLNSAADTAKEKLNSLIQKIEGIEKEIDKLEDKLEKLKDDKSIQVEKARLSALESQLEIAKEKLVETVEEISFIENQKDDLEKIIAGKISYDNKNDTEIINPRIIDIGEEKKKDQKENIEENKEVKQTEKDKNDKVVTELSGLSDVLSSMSKTETGERTKVNKVEMLVDKTNNVRVTTLIDTETVNGNINISQNMVDIIKSAVINSTGNLNVEQSIDIVVTTKAADGKPISISVPADDLKENAILNTYIIDPVTKSFVATSLPKVQFHSATGISTINLEGGYVYQLLSEEEAALIDSLIMDSIQLSDEFSKPIETKAGDTIDLNKALNFSLNKDNINMIQYVVEGDSVAIDQETGTLVVRDGITSGEVKVSIVVTLKNNQTKNIDITLRIGK